MSTAMDDDTKRQVREALFQQVKDLGTTPRRALFHLAGLRDESDPYPLAFDVYAYDVLRRCGLARRDGYPNHRITPHGARMAQALLAEKAVR